MSFRQEHRRRELSRPDYLQPIKEVLETGRPADKSKLCYLLDRGDAADLVDMPTFLLSHWHPNHQPLTRGIKVALREITSSEGLVSLQQLSAMLESLQDANRFLYDSENFFNTLLGSGITWLLAGDFYKAYLARCNPQQMSIMQNKAYACYQKAETIFSRSLTDLVSYRATFALNQGCAQLGKAASISLTNTNRNGVQDFLAASRSFDEVANLENFYIYEGLDLHSGSIRKYIQRLITAINQLIVPK